MKSVPAHRRTGQKGGLTVGMQDGLRNVVSGAGGRGDKTAYNRWAYGSFLDDVEIEAAYRTSGMVRKIHDLIPEDMTKKWRLWNTNQPAIAKLEAEERRLGVRAKFKEALRLARLRGGAAIVMGLPGQDSAEAPKSTEAGGLAYLHVFTRRQLRFEKLRTDLRDPYFDQPEAYLLRSTSGSEAPIHPSRVIVFKGLPTAGEGYGVTTSREDAFWGLPLLESLNEALQNWTMIHNGIAALIPEMKSDIISIPLLTDLVSTDAGEKILAKRLETLVMGRSQFNATLLDGGEGGENGMGAETWETRQLTFAGLPDVAMSATQVLAGMCDIPVTKLINSPPKGMNATGEYDDKNFSDMISSRQVTDMKPKLDQLDAFLIPSAGVAQTDNTTWKFTPIQEANPKDDAEVENKEAQAVDYIAGTNLIPVDALSKALVNRLEESGRWPGIAEAVAASSEPIPAIAAAQLAEKTALAPANDNTSRPVKVAGRGSTSRARTVARDASAFQDAAARPLYVSRKVLNPQELLTWARTAGIPNLEAAGELHVTVAYSRLPVEWLKVPSDWSGDDQGRLRIPPGGARLLERLGDGSALVLSFANETLTWRNETIRKAGASWDWPDYTPHITLSWDVPRDFDLRAVKPYQGRIVLSAERFEEIESDLT